MNSREEEFSISFGSEQGSHLLLLDSEDGSDITPPPLANPPSDASYSSSFLDMVKQSVERAQILYRSKEEESDSFDSILHFGSSQENEDKSEERVERGRREKDREPAFVPVGFESQQSHESMPEFAVLREDPLSVTHLRYTTNKRKKKEQQVKMALEAAHAQLLSETEKEPFLYFIQAQTDKESEEDLNEESDDDFSSWLCFDSQGSYAKFKHDIDDKVNQMDKPKQTEEQEEDESFSDLQQKIMMTSTPKRMFDLSKKRV
ncbi:hypothetical protein A0J61_00247 [Choanephora cucurbitarum]|uniref:Uncharacterized protein n=1 Tax=Choanephora cucurbitarum TaxID=101091 RepID=A0A1C7NRU5_9FUNG|nr:hypothetical protein A0J61_00247 [Choanephora cucurbitarum]